MKQAQLSKLKLPHTLKAQAAWESTIVKKAGDLAGDSALVSAINQHAHLIKGWQALDQVRTSRDPSITPATHLKLIKSKTESLVNSQAESCTATSNRLKARKAEIQNEINERLGLKSRENAQEVRSVIRSMSAKERGEAIRQAIENQDTEVLSAVFNGSSLLTGLTKEQISTYKTMAETRLAPDLLGLRDALDYSEKMLSDAFDDVLALKEQAIGNPLIEREYTEQSERAEAALANLDEAM